MRERERWTELDRDTIKTERERERNIQTPPNIDVNIICKIKLLWQVKLSGPGLHWLLLPQTSFRGDPEVGSYPRWHTSLTGEPMSKVSFEMSDTSMTAFSLVAGLVHCPTAYGEEAENEEK